MATRFSEPEAKLAVEGIGRDGGEDLRRQINLAWPPSRMEEGPFKGRAHIFLGFPGSQRKAGASIRYKTKSIP